MVTVVVAVVVVVVVVVAVVAVAAAAIVAAVPAAEVLQARLVQDDTSCNPKPNSRKPLEPKPKSTQAMSQSSGASVRGPGSVSGARPATHCCTSLHGVVK